MTERQAPDMLSPEETARRLGINVRTLARWAQERRIPFVLLPSGHRRYRVEDIEALATPKQASA